MKADHFVHSLPLAIAMQVSQMPAAVGTSHDGIATDARGNPPQTTHANLTGDDVQLDIDRGVAVGMTVEQTVDFGATAWTKQLEARFDALVTKEAVGTITRKEYVELETLQRSRRRLKSPPTGEEILQRHRREKLDRDLLIVLRRHVRIQNIANYT